MAQQVRTGDLFRRVGANQPTWQVVGFLRDAPLPHAKLQKVDGTAAQMTIGLPALLDERYFERVIAAHA